MGNDVNSFLTLLAASRGAGLKTTSSVLPTFYLKTLWISTVMNFKRSQMKHYALIHDTLYFKFQVTM